MLPTFIIAGAQKCGTTSLAQALKGHDEIHMSKRKELHFFDRHFQRGTEWYESQFSPKPRHRQVGEATPAYMYDPEARARMVETLPDARIIMILRNPVDRAYSHFWHKRRLGHEQIESFEEAIAAEPERSRSSKVRRRNGFAYVARGHYIDQIEGIVEAYGRERVLVTLLDDVIADQTAALTEVLEFLEVDSSVASRLEMPKSNSYRVKTESGETVSVQYEPMREATRRELTQAYDASNERLARFLGRDLSRWRQA